METESPNFLTQLSLLWNRLNSSEKLIVIASVLILLIAFGLWIGVSRKPDYGLLYGNLEAADAGRVISELQARNTKYDVREGGKSIYVPVKDVDELRISLAADGFMPTGTTGYEILDTSPLGMSDFLQRRRTTQALEGELSRTLMSLDEVTAARVHLTLAEPTPFISEQTEPVASVVLNVVPPGAALSADKVAAVRTFVAGAIASAPDNVTIIDQNMNLLTGPTLNQATGLLPTQEEARRNYEKQRAADIRTLLERAYGMGRVAVSFSCEMDFDQVQIESLQYQPVSGTDHGVLVSQETTESSMSGNSGVAPVGVPGTESNVPSYIGTSNQPYRSESATETKNYETSSTHEIRTQAPGAIKTRTVGVIIDSTDANGDAREVGSGEKTEVENLVAAAAGLNLAAGDVITVAFRPFDTSLKAELAPLPWTSSIRLEDVLSIILLIFVVFIVLMVVKNFLKPLPMPTLLPATGPIEEEDIAVELPVTDPKTLEKIRVREEIERLISEDPAGASKVIKTWLKE